MLRYPFPAYGDKYAAQNAAMTALPSKIFKAVIWLRIRVAQGFSLEG